MSGWDGSGGFTLPYNWVVDAANGIPISSSRMMTQENTLVGGLLDCVTRDNQTPPTADLSFAGHKITNLGTPTAATDAATKLYADGAGAVNLTGGTFLAYAPVPTFIGIASFKFSGVDATSIIIPGRRLKIVHNTGGTTSYGTVQSAVFATDTTVVMLMDNAVSLVSTVTSVAVGLEAPVPDAIPRRTMIQATGAAANLSTSANTSAQIPTFVKAVYSDPLGELNAATGLFTPTRSGLYRISFTFQMLRNGATIAAGYNFRGGLGTIAGSTISGTGFQSTVDCLVPVAAFTVLYFSYTFVMPLTAAQAYLMWIGNNASTFTGGPVTGALSNLTIEALYYN